MYAVTTTGTSIWFVFSFLQCIRRPRTMDWDSQFFSPADIDDATPTYGNPYSAMRQAKMRAATPEGGLRYEQGGIPARVDPPGCPCGNCPWRATVERGAALVAMPRKSLDDRTDEAMEASVVRALRDTLEKYGKESFSGSSISIIPQTLDTRMFIILFVFVLVIYVILTAITSIADLRREIAQLRGTS